MSRSLTPGSESSSGHHHVRLRKAVHVFSAGHFITLHDTLCEPVHGHNWTVSVDVAGPLDDHGMVFDFIALRDLLTNIVATLDHRMLLPTANPRLTVHRDVGPGGGDEVSVHFERRRWVFPAEECVLLPMVNTTAELLARWIGQQLIERLSAAGRRLPAWIRVEVDECLGQSADWQTTTDG
jgi:6-pyruvoyltetrahydropterin/6-carboxytetrahydropterin synthase